jgi:hypothetical protein
LEKHYHPKHIESLEDLCHRPKHLRQLTYLVELIKAVLRLREEYPRWGKNKLDTQPPREEIRKKTPSLGKDDGDWLKVGLPALHGPHQNRPWARILPALTREVRGLT